MPIGTFFVQFMYDRPALTAVDLLKTQFPLAAYIPAASLGWLVEQRVIKEQWVGGPSGPLRTV